MGHSLLLQSLCRMYQNSGNSAHPFRRAAWLSASKLWSNKGRPKLLGFHSTIYWSTFLLSTGPMFSKAQCGQTVSPPGSICLGMANWYHLPLNGASSLFLPHTLVPGIPALQSLVLLEGRGPPEQSPGNNFSLHFQARCFAEVLSDFVVTPS